MRRLLPAFLVLALALTLPASASAALRFKGCGGFGFRCARLMVPLDRSGRVPGNVSLFVERMRADRRPVLGATFVLAGGPGQSASDSFQGDALGQLYPAFRNRDLIVFDQRGTGRSGLLRCRRLERANLLNAGPQAASCAGKLGPARAFYTTNDTVEDMEAIRRELGVQRIAIYGTSYGTKVALAYALRYPQHVERLVLDSVVTADGPDPLYRDSLEAAPRALRALCRAGCRGITPDPVADVERLTARLAQGPLQGYVVSSRGRRRPARLDRAGLFMVLLAGDFDPTLRAAFPAAVRSTLAGDLAPILRLRHRAFKIDAEPPPAKSLSAALYAATSCEETAFPWSRTATPAERRQQAGAAAFRIPDSVFRPFDRGTALRSDLLALCDHWPAATTAPALGPGPYPDVPVLILEGEDDLRTPLEGARRVAASFPHATVVKVRATGHSVLGSDLTSCSSRAFSRFFRGRPIQGCRRARRQFPPLPVTPTSLRRVASNGPVRGVRGRALTAVGLTLRDVADDTLSSVIAEGDESSDLARGGGLRGGRYRVDADNVLTMHGLIYVPGVHLSGRIAGFGERHQHGRLRVTGPAVPAGTLRVRGAILRGRLGGRRVRGRLRPGTESVGVAAHLAAAPG